MKGVSFLFTIFLFVLAGQLGFVLKRSGALPAQDRELPRSVAAPVPVVPAHPQAPEAVVNL